MTTLNDFNTTIEEAYAMSYSLALQTLNSIMLDESAENEDRIYAAESVLENPPKQRPEKTTTKTNNTKD